MKIRLQDFGFKKSLYERPNQKWLCGRACDGAACLAGPSKSGKCPAEAECRPVRKGDRWHCTRPAGLGGPCVDGPGPEGACGRPVPRCTPVPTLRALRGRLAFWTVGVTVSLLLLLLSHHNGSRVVSPGELTFAHSSAKSRCTDCHKGAAGAPILWLEGPSKTPASHENSAGCISCHSLGPNPLSPHSVPVAQLAAWTASARMARGVPAGHPARLVDEPLACADCHKEHRGRNANLRRLSNAQCQTCHSHTFDGFTDGHPEFATYPFVRRTRILFDHSRHLGGHFSDPSSPKFAPRLCLDCHQSDLKTGGMLLRGFDATCGPCHGEQVSGKGAVKAGIPFLSLPRFDDRALSGAYAIGEWPEDADQEMSAFERVLLTSDPEVRAALETLKGADIGNLTKGDSPKLKAAQQVAWALKGLILDLQTKGHGEILARLEKATGRSLTRDQAQAAPGLLEPEMFKAPFGAIFPHLREEVEAYRGKQKAAETRLTPSPPAPTPSGKTAPPESLVSSGGWYSVDGAFSILYRPTGHADRFLTAWMDVSAAAGGAATALFNELSAPKAVGFCGKCHSVDANPTVAVQWHAAQPAPADHSINRFSHSAHLSLLDNRGCQTCHALKDDVKGAPESDGYGPSHRDPAVFTGNFKTIAKATCAECHKPTFVRDDCLLCHNYHVHRLGLIARNAE